MTIRSMCQAKTVPQPTPMVSSSCANGSLLEESLPVSLLIRNLETEVDEYHSTIALALRDRLIVLCMKFAPTPSAPPNKYVIVPSTHESEPAYL